MTGYMYFQCELHNRIYLLMYRKDVETAESGKDHAMRQKPLRLVSLYKLCTHCIIAAFALTMYRTAQVFTSGINHGDQQGQSTYT